MTLAQLSATAWPRPRRTRSPAWRKPGPGHPEAMSHQLQARGRTYRRGAHSDARLGLDFLTRQISPTGASWPRRAGQADPVPRSRSNLLSRRQQSVASRPWQFQTSACTRFRLRYGALFSPCTAQITVLAAASRAWRIACGRTVRATRTKAAGTFVILSEWDNEPGRSGLSKPPQELRRRAGGGAR